jgi:hypothetical protein
VLSHTPEKWGEIIANANARPGSKLWLAITAFVVCKLEGRATDVYREQILTEAPAPRSAGLRELLGE